MTAVSPAQCKAARALLGWTQADLAKASTVAARTLADFEVGLTKPNAGTVNKIANAFTAAGIVFVAVPEATGGVILLR